MQTTNEIVTLLEERKRRLDLGIVNGVRALHSFTSDLVPIAFNSKDFEVTRAFLFLTLIPRLLRTYFERRLQETILERIVDSKEYSISSIIKIMLKREIHGLDVDKYFDVDFIPIFEKIKEDFNTIKSLKNLPEELGRKYIAEYFETFLSLILDCSDPILKEINMKVSSFFAQAIEALSKNPSTSVFKDEVEKFVISLHKEVYGWP